MKMPKTLKNLFSPSDVPRAEKDEFRSEALKEEVLQTCITRGMTRMPILSCPPPLPIISIQAVPLHHAFVTRMSVGHSIQTNPNASVTVALQIDTDQEGLNNLKEWYSAYEKEHLFEGKADNTNTTKEKLNYALAEIENISNAPIDTSAQAKENKRKQEYRDYLEQLHTWKHGRNKSFKRKRR